MADLSVEFFASLHRASFGGIPFSVESFEGTGGRRVAEQPSQVGVRVLSTGPAIKKHSFRAYLATLVGPSREPRDVLKDFAALKRAVNGDQPQTLIHPWEGALADHLCTEFVPRVLALEIGVRFDATFAPATFPRPAPQPVDIAQTGDEARASMVALAPAFADETVPFDELSLAALQLETVGATDQETATATTAKLLSDGNIAVSGVPGAVQSIGQATRAVDAGEYTTDARRRLYADVLNIACSRNSATLLNQLQVFKLLLSDLGGGALAKSIEVTSGSLQSIAIAAGTDPRILAARNRETVRRWFPRGTVQL